MWSDKLVDENLEGSLSSRAFYPVVVHPNFCQIDIATEID